MVLKQEDMSRMYFKNIVTKLWACSRVKNLDDELDINHKMNEFECNGNIKDMGPFTNEGD